MRCWPQARGASPRRVAEDTRGAWVWPRPWEDPALQAFRTGRLLS